MKPQKINKNKKRWYSLIVIYLFSLIFLSSAMIAKVYGNLDLLMIFSGLFGEMIALFVMMSYFFLHNQEIK